MDNPAYDTITAIESTAEKGRVLVVFNDNEHDVLKLHHSITKQYGLYVGMRLLPDVRDELQEADSTREARIASVRMLGRRAMTQRALYERLQRRGHPHEAAKKAVNWLTERGFLDDRQYAAGRLEVLKGKRTGLMGMQMTLRREGVEQELAEEMIAQFAHGSGFDEVAEACALAEERNARLQDVPWPKRRNRIYGFLKRRGYDDEAVFAALDHIAPDNDIFIEPEAPPTE